MKRVSEALLCATAATCAIDVPALPLPIHVTVADACALLAAVAFAIAWLRGEAKVSTANGALYLALAYLACAGLSALVHHSGGFKIIGIAELVCLFLLASSLGNTDRIIRFWTWGAAFACLIGVITAALFTAGFDPSPLYTGAGELGARWRPAGLCRSGMLAQVSLVPLILLILDGKSFARWRIPLITLFSITIALTVTRTILAVPFALLLARRNRLAFLLIAVALASIYIDVHGGFGPGIRWRIAASALHNGLTHPFFGLGPTEHAALAAWPGPTDTPLSWDAHNTALDLFATLGLPALLAFAATVALVLRIPPPALLAVCVYATLFDSLTVDLADFRHTWILLGLGDGVYFLPFRPTTHTQLSSRVCR
jgi:hypothetical protein